LDSKQLNPRNNWKDKSEYDKNREKLSEMFVKNFKKYNDCNDLDLYGPIIE
jgi:ATP-dependent phosphoenolpyruvate carboxykinase